jgi:hypothetical protein
MKTLTDIFRLVGETNEQNGFNGYSQAREDGYGTQYLSMKDLLSVGEQAEAQEELRAGHEPDEIYLSWPPTPASLASEFASGQEATEHFRANTPGKPEGYIVEKLDAIIRDLGTLYEIVQEHGLPITVVEETLVRKVEFNASRGFKHGGKAF